MFQALPLLKYGISLFRFPSRTMKFGCIRKRLLHCSAALTEVHWPSSDSQRRTQRASPFLLWLAIRLLPAHMLWLQSCIPIDGAREGSWALYFFSELQVTAETKSTDAHTPFLRFVLRKQLEWALLPPIDVCRC